MATREELIQAFAQRGHQLWLVGGAVRDRVMGLADSDHDYATEADPDEVAAVAESLGAPVSLVGQRFGTVGVLVDGKWSEITTFRGDSYSDGSRWPDVTFGRSIEEDLARRDFTANAIAVNAATGQELDLFGGRQDIAARVIRAVGEPPDRFREDPLRILRGLRFASQLGFEVEPETLAGMRATVGLIASLSQERITSELDKLLCGREPARGLELLHASGALDVALPEVAPMVGCEQNHWHQFDVWGHTVATVEAIDVSENVRLRRWAAFLHDIGKPEVRHVKADGEWGFYRHETVGGAMATRLLERLKVGRQDSAAIVLLVRRHMDRPDAEDARSVRRFMRKLDGRWRDLVALKRADNVSHTYDDAPYHDDLEAACARIEVEEAERLRAESPLTGDDLVALAGRGPGPWIKPIKERLSAMVLDGDLEPGDRDGATRVAREMLDAGSVADGPAD